MNSPLALLMPAAMPPHVALPEHEARAVCLLQACESGATGEAAAPAAWWTHEDAAWANRMADASLGEAAPLPAWLAERARLALPRLLPRRLALEQAFKRRLWRAGWVMAAAAAGFVLGVLADLVGPSQQINLLAVPLWGIVAWNLGVYALLALSALQGMWRTEGPAKAARGGVPGWLRRAVGRWLAGRGAEAGRGPWALALPEQRFAALWARASAPLAQYRAALLMHVAALALALGLTVGLYARALVLDYRVAWQSTLLEPPQVHAVLERLLAPAAWATGIDVPGADAVAALRTRAGLSPADGPTDGPTHGPTHGANPGPTPGPSDVGPSSSARPAVGGGGGGAGAGTGTAASSGSVSGMGSPPGAQRAALRARDAAPWLHLLAATLLLAVVLPRGALAVVAAAWAHWRSRRLRVLLDDAGIRALLAARWPSGDAVRGVQVLPHGVAPSAAAALALRGLLAALWGDKLEVQVAPSTAHGDEDRAWPEPATGTALRLAWFDLAATPEEQAQGRFIAAGLAPRPAGSGAAALPPLVLLVDEAGYRQRMGAHSPRIAERRRAWQAFARQVGLPIVGVDLSEAAGPKRSAAAEAFGAALAAAASGGAQAGGSARDPGAHGWRAGGEGTP